MERNAPNQNNSSLNNNGVKSTNTPLIEKIQKLQQKYASIAESQNPASQFIQKSNANSFTIIKQNSDFEDKQIYTKRQQNPHQSYISQSKKNIMEKQYNSLYLQKLQQNHAQIQNQQQIVLENTLFKLQVNQSNNEIKPESYLPVQSSHRLSKTATNKGRQVNYEFDPLNIQKFEDKINEHISERNRISQQFSRLKNSIPEGKDQVIKNYGKQINSVNTNKGTINVDLYNEIENQLENYQNNLFLVPSNNQNYANSNGIITLSQSAIQKSPSQSYQSMKKQFPGGQKVIKINKKRREIKPSNLLGGDYFMFLEAKRQGSLKMIKDCDEEVLYKIWQMQERGINLNEGDFLTNSCGDFSTINKTQTRQPHYNRRVNVQYLIGQNQNTKNGIEEVQVNAQSIQSMQQQNVFTQAISQVTIADQQFQQFPQNQEFNIFDNKTQNNQPQFANGFYKSTKLMGSQNEVKNQNEFRLYRTKDDFDKESIQKIFKFFNSPNNRPMSSCSSIQNKRSLIENKDVPIVSGSQIIMQYNQLKYMNNIQKVQNNKNDLQKQLSCNIGTTMNQIAEQMQQSKQTNPNKPLIKNTPRAFSRPVSQSEQTGIGAYLMGTIAENNRYQRKSIKNINNSPQDQIITTKQQQIQQKQENYRDFINLINYSNNLIVPYNLSNPNPPLYKAYIGLGNNGIIVRQIMKSRWWWQLVENNDDWPDCQFLWMQWRRKEYTKYMKSLPQLQIDKQIVKEEQNETQDDQGKTLVRKKTFIEQSRKKGESYQKIVQKLLNTNDFEELEQFLVSNKVINFLQFLQKSYFIYQQQKTFVPPLISKDSCSEKFCEVQNKKIVKLKDPLNYKLHNHIQNNFHICNKKALFYNMRQYYECLGKNPFDYIPLTFHIREGVTDAEWERFSEVYNQIDQQVQENEKLRLKIETEKLNIEKPKVLKNIWIIKPGEATNRGTGIQVEQDIKAIQNIVDTKEVHSNGKNKTFIVQKYLERPLLYNKRKFDIRCYMLITTYNGIIKGYWYQEGYIRTSSKEFTLRNLENKFIHLTNDAIQKKGEEFGKFEIGNKLSFNEFQRYMDTINGSNATKYNFMEKTYQDMRVILCQYINQFLQDLKQFCQTYYQNKQKNVATDCVKAIFKKIEPQKKQFSFELFGLDFMIDDSYKTWLIEVNTNPCLETSCPLLSRVISTLVENVLKVAVDPIFPPPNFPKSKKHLIPDNIYESNKFELIFDELVDAANLSMLPSNIDEIQEEEIEEEEQLQIDEE